jgi:DNA-binding NtrC family response regulator
MSFRGLEGSSFQCALWNRKLICTDRDQRRILVIHSDRLVGNTMTYILGLRGLSAVSATDVFAARSTVVVLEPHAILLDTRVGATKNYDFAREPCTSEHGTRRYSSR